MQAYQFTVTVKVENSENFITDNDDMATIVKEGIEAMHNKDLGTVEVEAEEQQ